MTSFFISIGVLAVLGLVAVFKRYFEPMTPEEIAAIADSIGGAVVKPIPTPEGHPRKYFVITAYTPDGYFYCHYTREVHRIGGVLLLSETIRVNVGILRQRSIRAEFLNKMVQEWGRRKNSLSRPAGDDPILPILNDLLALATFYAGHYEEGGRSLDTMASRP